MSKLVIYDSLTGNTKLLAESIYNYFKEKEENRVKAHINESNEIIGNFYCQGKMPLSVKERYINLIKANPEDKNLEVSLENFEKALSHPNEDDLNSLKNKLKEVI